MAYATPAELREYCQLTEEECPDAKATTAITYAQGFIDEYCKCPFEDPGSDSVYTFDGNGSSSIFSTEEGPFGSVTKIEYRDSDGTWTEYALDYYVKEGGEWIELSSTMTAGDLNWRVTGRLYRALSAKAQELLKRAVLGIAKLYLVPRDEPTGPSVSSMSYEGVSYSYVGVDAGHPTGNNEIDHILRTLRRRLIQV